MDKLKSKKSCKSEKDSKKNKNNKVICIIALSMCMLLTGIFGLQAIFKDKLDPIQNDNSENVQVDDKQDFEYLVDKYFEYFFQNENGTVSLQLNSNKMRVVSQQIDDADKDALNTYNNMLNGINSLVDDGTMYIASDGNYYLIDNANDKIRDWTGGKNDFYIRTKKVLFIPIPIGYYMSLSTQWALVFGLVSLGLSVGSAKFIGSKSIMIAFLVGFMAGVSVVAIEANIDWIFDIATMIFVAGIAINIAFASCSVAGAIFKIVLTLLSGYIYDTIGSSFFVQS